MHIKNSFIRLLFNIKIREKMPLAFIIAIVVFCLALIIPFTSYALLGDNDSSEDFNPANASIDNCLAFEPYSPSGNVTAKFALKKYNNPDEKTFSYSPDGFNWYDLVIGQEITITSKTYIAGKNPSGLSAPSNYYYFDITSGYISASGSVMSLIDGGTGEEKIIPSAYCFNMLFKDCENLLTPPSLPAIALDRYCYSGMFSGCASLVAAPDLPAKNLSEGCYSNLFNGCSLLMKGPELPATTLQAYCYDGMFRECTSLSIAPDLPAPQLASQCYRQLFSKCTSLTTAPVLPARLLANECYDRMFESCSSLTSVPEFSATKLAWKCSYEMFAGCVSLRTAPHLPATELAEYCYEEMFNGCTSLRTSPELPATILENYCYRSMFSGCKSLVAAPDIPATKVAEESCKWMFLQCESLVDVPELTADKLGKDCYTQMFFGCTALTEFSILPATQLAQNCYKQMFYGCTALEKAPELPATTLQASCYENMFENCTSLRNAPELPATNLQDNCYVGMFKNCTGLQYLKVAFTDWKDGSNTLYWLDGALNDESCVYECFAQNIPSRDASHVLDKWQIKNYSAENIMMLEPVGLGSASFSYSEIGSLSYNHFKYSTDEGQSWTEISPDEEITISSKVLICGSNHEGFNVNTENYIKFNINAGVSNNYIKASGSVLGLVDGPISFSKTEPKDYWFYKLFEGCDGLTQAPDLPSTWLANSCYESMFENCTSLTYAPELPSPKLLASSYQSMFSGCTSLSVTPVLPAKILSKSCYEKMFEGCTKLVFAPDLPAPRLETFCYKEMFKDCERVCSVKVGFNDWSEATNATEKWLEGVSDSSDGVFIGPTDLDASIRDTSHIPENWNVTSPMQRMLSLTPVYGLPAKITIQKTGNPIGDDLWYSKDGFVWEKYSDGLELNVATRVYFKGNNVNGFSSSENDYYTFAAEADFGVEASGDVMSLLYGEDIKTHAIPNPYCFYRLFKGCDVCTPPRISADALNEYCYSEMFSGCTQLTEAPDLTSPGLAKGCYKEMFKDCSSLSKISVNFTEWDDQQEYTNNWVMGVPKGTSCYFECPNTLDVSIRDDSHVPQDWTVKNYDLEKCLIFEPAVNRTARFSLTKNGEPAGVTFSYSTDGSNWKTLNPNELIQIEDKTYIRGDNEEGISSLAAYFSFSIKGSNNYIKASGDVMGLMNNGTKEIKEIKNSYGFHGLFKEANIVTAPKLSATGLTNYCYESMFEGCKSLTSAPELPANTLADGCYRYMFNNCSSLTTAPELPASELVVNAYYGMFRGCSALVTAPELPGTTLANACYQEMFMDCVSLINVYTLNADRIEEYSYGMMFNGCTSLVNAPKIMGTKCGHCGCWCMFQNCKALLNVPDLEIRQVWEWYNLESMFEGCESMEFAPHLPLNWFGPNDRYCYHKLFKDCKSLTRISCDFENWNYEGQTDPYYNTYNWVQGVPASNNGIFDHAAGLGELVYDDSRIPQGWNNGQNYVHNALCFEPDGCEKASFTLNRNRDDESFVRSIKISTNFGKNWSEMSSGTTYEITGKVFLKGDNAQGLNKDPYNFYSFSGQGDNKIKASGNIMGLVTNAGASTTIPNGYCFYHLFSNFANLTTAPKLPATSLTESCYQEMFKGCSSLTCPPVLPAENLALCCYTGMFNGCVYLGSAPELPAKIAMNGSYREMFEGCTRLVRAPRIFAEETDLRSFSSMFKGCVSLKDVPDLETSKLWIYCCEEMFSGCTSLINPPEINATELSNYSCIKMFSGCTKLSRTPELKLMNLENGCYVGMFQGCSSLTYAANLPARQLKENCYSGMFQNCTRLVSPPAIEADVLASSCCGPWDNRAGGMFEGCTSLNRIPFLRARELSNGCYSSMFKGCTSLEDANNLPEAKLANECYKNMFFNCTSLKTPPQLPAMTLAPNCYESMFYNCSSLTAAPALPSINPAADSYANMFESCKNLQSLEVPFITWGNNIGYFSRDWLKNSGTNTSPVFVCPKELDVSVRGDSTVPTNWKTNWTIEADIQGYVGVYDGLPHGISITNLYPTETKVEYKEIIGKWSTEPIEKVNAGIYEIYYRISCEGYQTLTGSETISISPSPEVDVDFVGGPYSKNYGDADPSFAATFKNVESGATVVYNRDYTITREPGENVGDYEVSILSLHGSNYIFDTVTTTLTINKATNAKLVADNNSKIATDDDPTLTAHMEGLKFNDALSSGDYEVEVEESDDASSKTLTPKLTEAGEEKFSQNYDIEATSFIQTGEMKLYDAKDLPMIKYDIASYNDVYDANDHEFKVVPYQPSSATVSYKMQGTTEWKTETFKFKNAGEYKIDFKLEADGYQTTESQGVLKVNPRPLAINADYKEILQGEETPEFTASSSFMPGGETIVKGTDYTISCSFEPKPGTYNIVVWPITSSETMKNYSTVKVDSHFVIKERSSLTYEASNYSGVYDGDEHSIEVNADDCTILYKTSAGGEYSPDKPMFTGVTEGSQTVYFKIVPNDETFATIESSKTVEISKKQITIAAEFKQISSGDPEPTYTASITGLVDGEELTEDDYSFTCDYIGSSGVYDIVVDWTPDSDAAKNYDAETVNSKLLVTSTAGKTEYTSASYNGVYDGQPHSIEVDVKQPADYTLEYSTDGQTFSSEKPMFTNAIEEQTVYFKITPTLSTYETVIGQESVEIMKAVASVVAQAAYKNEGEDDPSLTAQVFGLVNGESFDDPTDYYLTRAEGEDAGNYDITCHVNDNQKTSNYDISTASSKFFIIATSPVPPGPTPPGPEPSPVPDTPEQGATDTQSGAISTQGDVETNNKPAELTSSNDKKQDENTVPLAAAVGSCAAVGAAAVGLTIGIRRIRLRRH